MQASSSLSPLKTDHVLVPHQINERTRLLASLQRIAQVEIRESVKHDGNTHYVLTVLLKKSHSNIPTVQHTTSVSNRADFVAERRLSDFVNFRHAMYYHARAGHDGRPCAFCQCALKLTDEHPTRPRIHMRLFNGETSTRVGLEAFINSVVEVARQASNDGDRKCDGESEIPQLVHSFLFEGVEDNQKSSAQPAYSSTREVTKAQRSSPWSF